MILDIYKDSFEYTMQDIESILKLGLIIFCCFLIIPIFLVSGYSYRVTKIGVKGMINGNDSLPDFNGLWDMFKTGIKVIIVQLVNLIIPIILIVLSANMNKIMPTSTGNALSVILLIVGIILGIIGYLFYYAGIAHMADNDDKLSSSFDYKNLTQIIKSIGWIKYFIFFVILDIILIIISLLVIFVLILLFGLIGLGSAFFVPGFGIGFLSAGIIIAFLVFCFLVAPYLVVLKARAIGLIYNLR